MDTNGPVEAGLLDETVWEDLVANVRDGKCLPILGAGVCWGALPLGGELSRTLAERYRYPLADPANLAAVAQYVDVERAPGAGRRAVKEILAPKTKPPGFEPHRTLAELPCPLYLTTNYDDFMEKALEEAGRNYASDFCRWNAFLRNHPEPANPPRRATPLVYHFHGTLAEERSMVLTENDYYDMLAAMAADPNLVPRPVRDALQDAAPLVLGYGFADSTLRVLLRGLFQSLPDGFGRQGVIVQRPPDSPEARRYLEKYYAKVNLTACWIDAQTFVRELRRRSAPS